MEAGIFRRKPQSRHQHREHFGFQPSVSFDAICVLKMEDTQEGDGGVNIHVLGTPLPVTPFGAL